MQKHKPSEEETAVCCFFFFWCRIVRKKVIYDKKLIKRFQSGI